ncbi:energy-coupling factor transporter transmembrane component T family protein [Microbacterium amylolyticum]|uniref:Energy-coupling factor transport system permease protein n=1 Tax=Microbacterium amylolyticum TaxID=936337 RepID=A0ABS4ZI49_9MICO|nr:energy-coupling factor transporter transmembrane component T [Microbacterium amylolyticum]MBP2436665.1 energy-coupling factor transport system permease protein [Microbacterium amylolyticum]
MIPSIVEARGPLARINPVAKLAAAFLIAFPLIVSVDWVSGVTALLLEIPLFMLSGIGWRRFWLRTLPVWIAAPLTGVTIALYGQESGRVYADFLLITISDGSLELAAATFFRVLAIALPGVVLFADVDPTDLADGLSQRAKLPARFVLGALGGLRLVGLLISDWRELETARRARGVADQGRIRRLIGMGFALVVLAIRRGSHLATAMESRAFGADTARSWARESRWGGGEWLLMAAGVVISATAITVSVQTGWYNPIFGR